MSRRAREARERKSRGRRWSAVLLALTTLCALGSSCGDVRSELIVGAAVLGWQGTDLVRHVSFGFFSAMVLLLAHSMMMFYLIGKGKAVKDAMIEGGLTGDQYRRIALVRKPVFSIGTLAMAVTMIAAIVGASVDTGRCRPFSTRYSPTARSPPTCSLSRSKFQLSPDPPASWTK